MTVEMRMKDGRKFVGVYAKVHDSMVALHGPIGVYSDGPLVALVPVADVLEIVKVVPTYEDPEVTVKP